MPEEAPTPEDQPHIVVEIDGQDVIVPLTPEELPEQEISHYQPLLFGDNIIGDVHFNEDGTFEGAINNADILEIITQGFQAGTVGFHFYGKAALPTDEVQQRIQEFHEQVNK